MKKRTQDTVVKVNKTNLATLTDSEVGAGFRAEATSM